MRLSALLCESRDNIASGTTRATTFGSVLAAVLSALTIADSVAIAHHVSAAEDFRRAGGATLVVSAQGRVDGAACQELSTLTDVVAAGALRDSTSKVTASALPNAPVPLYEVSSGFASVLSASEPTRAGLILSTDSLRQLGANVGDDLATASGATTVASSYEYPADGRRAGLGYAALAVTDNREPFDECWVSSWPQITNLRVILLATVSPSFAAEADPPTIAQLNSSRGNAFAGPDQFMQRPTRAGTPAAAVIAGLLGFVAVRLRRLQLASMLHAGVRRIDLVVMQLVEGCAWSTPAFLIGVGTAAAMTRFVIPGEDHAQFVLALGISLAGFAGALIGVIMGALSARERHLFQYFKDR